MTENAIHVFGNKAPITKELTAGSLYKVDNIILEMSVPA